MRSDRCSLLGEKPLEIFGFSPASAQGNGPSWLDFYRDRVRWIPSRFQDAHFHGFSAPDDERCGELRDLFQQPRILMATRGGWGSLRILESLKIDPNWEGVLMGFSDITALLNTLPFRTSILCFHGPMYEYPSTTSNQGFLSASFEDFFLRCEQRSTGHFPGRILGVDEIRGSLVGGNLSVFLALAGTSYFPDLKGKVLFLEEIKEPTYRVDRMLTQLSLLPGFDELNGIIMGAFTKCEPSPAESGDFSMDELIDDFFERTGIPILLNAPIGHIDDFLILPMGGDSQWVEENGNILYSLEIPEGIEERNE